VARYPVGAPLQVHHDARRPADSVLELGLDPLWRKARVFSVVTVALGLAMAAVLLWA